MTTEVPQAEDDEASRPMRGQLYWILPIAVATMSVTTWLLVNPKWGGDVAAIIVIPVNVAAVIVPLLLTVSTPRAVAKRNPRRRRKLTIATALTAAILLTTGLVYWFSREEDPLKYLSGRVKIGVTSEKYPGWNTATKDKHGIGFDRELIKFLAEEYGFELDLVELDSLDARVDRLAEYLGKPDDIKLVISTFSITEPREKVIDFAGPYYQDTEGFFTYEQANSFDEIPKGTVCVTKGARASERLTDKGWRPVEGASLMDCVTRMKNPDDIVKAVSTDASILSELSRNIEGYGTPSRFEIGPERYGIGIPNNRPKLCEELNLKIRKFIENEWMGHIPENLPSVYDPRGHQPPIPLPTCMQPSS